MIELSSLIEEPSRLMVPRSQQGPLSWGKARLGRDEKEEREKWRETDKNKMG